MRRSMTFLLACFFTVASQAQEPSKTKEESVAIVAMDVQGLQLDNIAMGNLIRLELAKTQQFEVLDKYDAARILEQNEIDPANTFGKQRLVEVGQMLNADKMLTGSTQKFGDKIIFTLRLIDVKQQRIVKTSVKEYVYDENHLQRMARISVHDLLGLQTNERDVEVLVNFDRPITSDKSTLKLNGPRFGLQFFHGQMAERLKAPESEGGYDGNSFASVFAYQYEKQYISSGDFQALFEFIGAINGIESGYTTPSLTVLNGIRYKGWEIGFGPSFRLAKTRNGAFTESGWRLEGELPEGHGYEVVETIDSRGTLGFSTGLVFAAGKTITSGYLNLPINVYYAPTPEFDGGTVGFMVGFTIAKNQK